MRRAVVVTTFALVVSACSAPSTSVAPSVSLSPLTRPAVTPEASVIPTQRPSEPTPTSTAIPSEASTLGPDQFAEVVTSDLVVRSAPGTGADSEISPQWLDAPLKVYVVDGPTMADGYTWYLVTSVLEPVLEATPSGWVAAAGKDGEPWLVPYTMPCRMEPTMDELLAMQALQRLGCYGGREFTLKGFLNGCASAAGGPWETGCFVYGPGFDIDATRPPCIDLCPERALIVHFAELPESDEGRISFSGHFDDPAAWRCAPGASALALLDVLGCRTQFVATSFVMTDAP